MKQLYRWMIVLLVLAMFAGCAAPAAPTAVPAAPTAVPAAPTAVPAAPTAVPAAPTAVPAAPTAAPEPTKAPEPAAPVTLKVWYISQNEVEIKMMQELSGNFEKANPGVTVEFSPITLDEARKTWKLAVDSNTGPDVAYIGSGGPFMNATGAAGLLVDLAPYAKERGWDKNISPWDNVTTYNPFGGPVFGIPYDYAVVNVFYNTDMFTKLGLSVPKTWAELETLFAKLNENGVTPFTVGGLDIWPYDHQVYTLANTVVPHEEMYTTWRAEKGATLSSPGWLKAFTTMKEWVDKGYYEEGFQGFKYADAQNSFMAGNVAMIIDGTWAASAYLANATFTPGFFALPQIDPSLPWHCVLGPNNFWLITKASTNVEAGVDYIDYMLGEEVALAKWNAGDIPMFKFAKVPEAKTQLQVDIYNVTGQVGTGFYMNQNIGTVSQVFESQLVLMLEGKATPEQAVAEIQVALDKFLVEKGVK